MCKELDEIKKLHKKKLQIKKKLSYSLPESENRLQLQCEYLETTNKLYELLIPALLIFSRLTPKQEDLMCLRYIEGRTWEQISYSMYLNGTNNTFKLHKRAKQAYCKIKEEMKGSK